MVVSTLFIALIVLQAAAQAIATAVEENKQLKFNCNRAAFPTTTTLPQSTNEIQGTLEQVSSKFHFTHPFVMVSSRKICA